MLSYQMVQPADNWTNRKTK